jgi:hypothetical protein
MKYYQCDHVKDDVIRVINETVNAYVTVVVKPERSGNIKEKILKWTPKSKAEVAV